MFCSTGCSRALCCELTTAVNVFNVVSVFWLVSIAFACDNSCFKAIARSTAARGSADKSRITPLRAEIWTPAASLHMVPSKLVLPVSHAESVDMISFCKAPCRQFLQAQVAEAMAKVG